MAIKLIATLANTMLDLISTQVDLDAGAGVINVYDSPQPATPETAITSQTLLATLTFSDPTVAAGATGSLLTFDDITDDSSAVGGVAAWARITDNSGDAVFDIDVTATGGGGGLEFNTVTFVTGKVVSVSAFTIAL